MTPKLSTLQRRLVRNMGSSYFGFAVGSAVTLLLMPYLVRRLGAAEFGLWILLRTVLGYFQLLELGTMPAVIRYVSLHRARDEHREVENVVAASMRILGWLALAAMPGAALVGWLGPRAFGLTPELAHTFRNVWWLLGAGALAAYFKRLFVAVIEGHQRYDLINACSSAGNVLAALAMVVVVEHGHGVQALLAVYVIRTAAEGLVQMLLVRRTFGIRPNPFVVRRDLLGSLAGYSLWAFFVDVASRISHEIDVLVIGIFLPVASITPYEIGMRIAGVVEKVTEPMVAVFFPLAAELSSAERTQALRRLLVEGTRAALLVTTPVLLVLAWHGAEIITWWVGPDYVEPSLPVLYALLGAVLMAVLDAPSSRILLGTGQVRFDAAVSGAIAAVNLVLSILLVRPYGITGVAIGTLVPAVIFNLFVSVPYVCRLVELPVTRFAVAVGVPVAAVAVAGGAWMAIVHVYLPPGVVAFAADSVVAVALAGTVLLLLWRRRREAACGT